MAQRTTTSPSGWVGWAYFAAAMLLAVGGMQIIAGLVGIFNSDFYVATADGSLVAFNYTTWGWVQLSLGVLALLTGTGLLAGATWARVVAVFVAVLAMIGNLATLTSYPLWSIVALIVNGCVIYALTMHGSELQE